MTDTAETTDPTDSQDHSHGNGVGKALVAISRISEDHDIQIRGEVNSATVKDYESIVREFGRMTPIELFHEGEFDRATTQFMVMDGFHRIAAYRAAGLTKVHAYYRRMTKSQAIEFALRANGRHGMPMSKSQKRAATEIAVRDARIGEYADIRIARMIGVSASLVSQVRRGISPESAAERAEQSRTVKSAQSIHSESSSHPVPTHVEEESAAPAGSKKTTPLTPDPLPTKSKMINQIQRWINDGVVDEIDVIKAMNTPDGEYVFLPNPASPMTLRVVGSNGRVQIEVPVALKEATFDTLVVRYAAGKLIDSGV